MACDANRRNLWGDIRGAALIEYTVLIGLLAAGVIIGLQSAFGWIEDQWQDVAESTEVVDPPESSDNGGDDCRLPAHSRGRACDAPGRGPH